MRALASNSRRQFLGGSLALCTYALLREVRAVAPANLSMSANRWVAAQSELAQGLASGTLTQRRWHDAVNDLAGDVDIEDLSRMIRRASSRSVRPPQFNEPRRRFIAMQGDDGVVHLPYSIAVFDFTAASVIAPHGHRNMASAHLVMDGRIRIRTYDRLADDDGSLVVRPTGDLIATSGHAAAMTPQCDNVHWFAAQSRRAMTVDVVIAGLDKGSTKPYEVQPVDALAAVVLRDGTLRVPLISAEESRRKYSATR